MKICRSCRFWDELPNQPEVSLHYGYCTFPVFLPVWITSPHPVTAEETNNCPVHHESVKETDR